MSWYKDKSATAPGLTGGYAHKCNEGEFSPARIVALPFKSQATLECQHCLVAETLNAIELPEIWLESPRSIPDIIKDMRLSHPWTQDEFAEMLQVHPRTVKGWEAGEYKPRQQQVVALRMLMPSRLVSEFMKAWRNN